MASGAQGDDVGAVHQVMILGGAARPKSGVVMRAQAMSLTALPVVAGTASNRSPRRSATAGHVTGRRRIYTLYRSRTAFINNWDLVDASAPHIVGAWPTEAGRR